VRRSTALAALAAVAVLAFLARAAGYHEVFSGGTIVFPVGDPYYHLRRALYTLQHFPQPLLFDPLVAYPDGARIHWPPLHDLLLAALGRCLGGTPDALERAAAWLPPVLGALAVAPIFAAGALFGGRGLGLGAAAIYALLPASIEYSNVGDADHHCTVGVLNALWLYGALAAALPRNERGARIAAHALVAVVRAALLLVWPGSVLYIALADGSQLAVEALCGRGARLLEHAAGMLATAALVVPILPGLGPPVGGPYSAEALSWLQPTALAALALLAAGCAGCEQRWPARRIGVRALRSGGLGIAVGAAMLALPGPREAVVHALTFVGKSEPWARLNAEQLPLLRPGRPGGWLAPISYFGGFGYLLPLVPLVALWRAREARVRQPALLLAAWTAGFGALAALQIRYGNDYAPAGAVGFALALDAARRALARSLPRLAARLAAAALVVATAGPLVGFAAQEAWATLRALPPLGDPLLATPDGTLYRFAEMVRAATPETRGFDAPDQHPEYGILCSPNIGHVLHYVARRATTADNFGPYSGARHFAEARGFTWLESEQAAVALANRLGARYAVTMEYGPAPPRSLAQRLHREDGLERQGAARWEHFRLVTEGPAGGTPLSMLFGAPAAPGSVPYKLYEIVPGALLEAEAAPGTRVEASVTVRTPAGRRFVYTARGAAGADGVARLRVPYATETQAPARPIGPWLVRVGDAEREVAVSESAVREGSAVAVGGPRG
jgi:dolichyl-diphosphooligosaccharide--protein glycosyltransferase